MPGTKKCKHCKSEIDKEAKVCPVCKKKQRSILKPVVIAIALLIAIGAFINQGENTNNTATTDNSTSTEPTPTTVPTTAVKPIVTEESAATTEPTAAVAKMEPFEIKLSAGHYTAGIDFPSGKYTLKAISGSGNVSSSNLYSGGLNEIMAEPPDDDFINIFNNAKLEDGVVLSIAGNLIINMSTEEANTSILIPRTNELTETIELGSGNYVAGEDFPAGVYNIVAKSGSGNVNSSNMYEGGLNEVMSTEADDMYIKEFKNASLDAGVELSVSGVTVQLVPSK